MASIKYERDRNGVLKAKIQAYSKDPDTGKRKLYSKRVYNNLNLTELKFKKYVEKEAIDFENNVEKAYEYNEPLIASKVLTVPELMKEWKDNIKTNLSLSYYHRVCEVEEKFYAYLKSRGLYEKPISEITVRDIQLFFDLEATKKYTTCGSEIVKLINPLPKCVNFRHLERKKIITRPASYNMNNHGKVIKIEAAQKICNEYGLKLEQYFEKVDNTKYYSQETLKGYRRMLRTLFNEAVRYDWISKNPVCRTKIGSGNLNISIREVPEKEVFSFSEVSTLLNVLDNLPDYKINQKICIKIMLFTGVRSAELCGLRWSDIDMTNRIIYVRRNRLYSDITKEVYEKCPKTKTSTREIPIPTDLYNDLIKFQDWFRKIDYNFDIKQDQYYVAVNRDRKPLFPHTIGHYLRDIEQANGLKNVTCHGLRHTYCSLLLAQNVPIQTVSKYMGHSDSTITLQVYAHFIPDTKEKVINALDNISKNK